MQDHLIAVLSQLQAKGASKCKRDLLCQGRLPRPGASQASNHQLIPLFFGPR